MASITSGTIGYTRALNLGDYNSKKADVTLAFTLNEGDNLDGILSEVSQLCVFKAHEILNRLSAGAATRSTPQVSEGAPDTAAPAEGTAPAATTARKGRPPRANKGPQADPTAVVDAEVVSDPTHGEGDVIPNDDDQPEPEQLDDASVVEDEDWSAAAPEVTDKDLVEAISKHNQVVKNAPAIRALIGEFVEAPGQAKDIPQEHRASFLEKLKKVPALQK